ncbi:MAG TPA: putative quinol monooxygenase [Acidimicrobiales bacterium]|nr:putative quinol monooxygenase [Acidimicrobiales bacterium]
MSSKFAAIAKLTAVEGQRDALVKVMDQLVEAAADEPGTEVYVLHVDNNDPNAIWFYELYPDAEANAVHSKSDTMAAVIGQLGGLVAGAPEIHFMTPHSGTGIDL